MTTLAPAPKLSDGTGGLDKMERHIVPRVSEGGPMGDKTLCGKLWDRSRPQTGEMCSACVEEYRRLHPGWPLPTV